MLPSSLERDDIMWWRVDDLWWSSLEAFLAWAVHEHLVSYVALLSHSFVIPFFYSSLTLGTSKHVKADVMCIVHSYNMDDKIRRMIVTFEYICQKEWSCLTYGRIVHLYKMYPTLHDCDYHLPKIRYATF